MPGVGIFSGILNIFFYYIHHSAVLLIFIHIRTIFSIDKSRFPRCQINWRICGLGMWREPLGTIGKVKCLLCEASFVKKGARMLSHLGYKGPNSVRDKGVLLCPRATPEIKRLFHKSGGNFLLYLERIGVALFDSSGTPRVGGLHALRQGILEFLHLGSSDKSVQVEIQGSKTNALEANHDIPNTVKHVIAMLRVGRQMR